MSGTLLHREGPLAVKVETIFTFLLPLLSAFYVWQATQVTEPPSSTAVGARTFPVLIGCLMFIVSGILAWQRWRARYSKASGSEVQPQLEIVPSEQDENSISDWPAVWTVLGSLLGLILLLEPLGFVVAIALFLFGLSTAFARARWLLHLGISIGFSTFFYYLFTRILEIPLPNGILKPFF